MNEVNRFTGGASRRRLAVGADGDRLALMLRKKDTESGYRKVALTMSIDCEPGVKRIVSPAPS